MKRKNIFKLALSPNQRLALWVSLDLLHWVSGSNRPKFSDETIDHISDTFDSLDGDVKTYEFNFTATHHRACSFALKYARLYLNGDFRHFDLPIPENIDSELKELAPVILALSEHFSG